MRVGCGDDVGAGRGAQPFGVGSEFRRRLLALEISSREGPIRNDVGGLEDGGVQDHALGAVFRKRGAGEERGEARTTKEHPACAQGTRTIAPARKAQRRGKLGGAGGNRTPDPQTASLMLSQLSYSPTGGAAYPGGRGCQRSATRARRARLRGWDPPGGVLFSARLRRSGGIGIRRALKRPRPHGRVGSSPTSGTHFGGRHE